METKFNLNFNPYQNIIEKIGLNSTKDRIALIGVPGIGKSRFFQFLSALLAEQYNVYYTSFGETIEMVNSRFTLPLKSFPNGEPILINEDYLNKCYHEYYEKEENLTLKNELFEYQNSNPKNSGGNLNLIDIKYAQDPYDLANQFETILKTDNSTPKVLFIDNVDDFKLMIEDDLNFTIDKFLTHLSTIRTIENTALIISSTIRPSNLNRAICLPGHWFYVNGKKGLIDFCNQVIFLHRESYYSFDLMHKNELEVYQIKNGKEVKFDKKTVFKYNPDFSCFFEKVDNSF